MNNSITDNSQLAHGGSGSSHISNLVSYLLILFRQTINESCDHLHDEVDMGHLGCRITLLVQDVAAENGPVQQMLKLLLIPDFLFFAPPGTTAASGQPCRRRPCSCCSLWSRLACLAVQIVSSPLPCYCSERETACKFPFCVTAASSGLRKNVLPLFPAKTGR